MPRQGADYDSAMNLKTVLAELEALGNERMREQNIRHGSSDNQYGVRLGDIRKVAKKVKADHDLAMELWNTGNVDAQRLAILSFKPKNLTADEIDEMIRPVTFGELADWFTMYVTKKHADKELLRERWMQDDNPTAARAGWSLTAERIEKSPDGLDIKALLDRIESEMADADPLPQWTMNFCLVGIGIHLPKHRKRALAIGEALGVFSDYPTPKGCTSPYAPIWINEMVSRQK